MRERKDEIIEATLIARVREGDREAREIYADWLEERGRLDRATILRDGASAMSSVVDLVRWLHQLGGLDDLGVFEIVPGCAAFALGAGSPIRPGSVAAMVMRPQVSSVIPTQVVIPESVAGHFLIMDIRVGNRSQLKTPDPIPASLFTPSSIAGHRGRISFEVVNTAQDFVIEAQNVSEEDRAFFALVFCRVPLRARAG